MNKDAPWERISTQCEQLIQYRTALSLTQITFTRPSGCVQFSPFLGHYPCRIYTLLQNSFPMMMKTKSPLSALMQKLDTPTIIPFFIGELLRVNKYTYPFLVIFYFMNWNIIKQLIIVSGDYLKIICRPSISWSLSYSHLLLPLSFMAIKPRQLIAWIFFGNFKQQVLIY